MPTNLLNLFINKMSVQYQSLEELKRKKALLKKELSDMEGLLTFDNAKESLSVMTNGFTDKFLKEEVDEEGNSHTALKKEEILKKITTNIKDKFISKNAVLGIADTALKGGAFEDVLKMGAVALVANFAKKNVRSGSWKQKLIGLALIYVAPFILKFIREKLEDYQAKKSISSMEKLI